MKRTCAAIAVTALASMALGLASGPAEARTRPPAQDTATIRVLEKWTYQGGKFAVVTKCAYRSDNGNITSPMLPRTVSLPGAGRNVLIHVTSKTAPGKYTIAFYCTTKKGDIDAFAAASVKILKTLPGWKQRPAPRLPRHFKAKVTVQSGPPAAKHAKKTKKHAKGH